MKNMLTKEAFAEWCEKQPANKEYDYANPRDCAFCQYLKGVGFEYPGVNSTHWRPDALGDDNRPLGVIADALARLPYTFGALAARLRSIPS